MPELPTVCRAITRNWVTLLEEGDWIYVSNFGYCVITSEYLDLAAGYGSLGFLPKQIGPAAQVVRINVTPEGMDTEGMIIMRPTNRVGPYLKNYLRPVRPTIVAIPPTTTDAMLEAKKEIQATLQEAVALQLSKGMQKANDDLTAALYMTKNAGEMQADKKVGESPVPPSPKIQEMLYDIRENLNSGLKNYVVSDEGTVLKVGQIVTLFDGTTGEVMTSQSGKMVIRRLPRGVRFPSQDKENQSDEQPKPKQDPGLGERKLDLGDIK